MMLQQDNSNLLDLHQREFDSNSRNQGPFILEDIAELLKIPIAELPKHARVDVWLRLLDRREQTTGEALITDSQKNTIREYGKVIGKNVLLDPNEFIELLEKLVAPVDRSSFLTRDGEEVEEEEDNEADHEEEEDDHEQIENEPLGYEGNPLFMTQRQQRSRIGIHLHNHDNDINDDDNSMGQYDDYNNNNDHHEYYHHHQQRQEESEDDEEGDETNLYKQQRHMFKDDVLDSSGDPVISQIMDARQRTSKMLNFTPPRFKFRRFGHPDESDNESGISRGGSANHPSVSAGSTVSIQDEYDHQDTTRAGGALQSKLYTSRPPPPLRDNTLDADIRPMASVSESLHNQHSSTAQQRRLQEAERRLDKVSQEYDEQIAKLEVDLSSMRHEIVMHKKTIAEYQAQESNRTEHITTLEKQLEESKDKGSKLRQSTEELKGELDEKNEELERLQDTLQKATNKLKYVETNFEQLYQEYNAQKSAQDKVTELQVRLDQELEATESLYAQLENKKKENKRMKHIIDDMKTDLDEARRHAAQLVVPYKSLGDELGESSSVALDTKEVQTEQPEQDLARLKDQEKLESLAIILTKTEEQLEETESRLDFSEQRAEELENNLTMMEQDLKKVKRRRDELHQENQEMFQEIETLEVNLKRQMEVNEQAAKKKTRSTGVQSTSMELCDTCGYIAAEHESAIHDLTLRVQDQAETIRRVRALNTRKHDSAVTEYITMAHNTLFHETTKTARTWRFVLFIVTLYTMVQTFVFFRNMVSKVSYGVEDHPYVTLYPLPVGPYTSRNRFVDEMVFWLQSLLLDADDYSVAQ
ncbi:hypothetical protein BDA99DRAFT_542191 [Phascolomyces articulosus]|uniref:Uncharacterized protein n=1 Tax=Phascolomyces articulosus TaxID=60185 RepID=A0AAD5K3U0_9FUNG|nr:hypothetical protein BDA99DRAFT_542191 [Phascolomyces articulosus]